jgi:acetyl/propionyl-CoA carboxylase alpha subunit
LFIANRGEVARRIMKTAKRLGFKTAVAYPPCDEDLPFVRESDFSLRVETKLARQVYVDISRVIESAKILKATHLHPGYGFLSERPEFVRAVEAAGIEFVGPDAASMQLLGDKVSSRSFLKKLNIPLLPSYEGEDLSIHQLQFEANRMGYPLLVKPSAGGGGKGMIKVFSADELAAAVESSQRIALESFGDSRIFLESYVPGARHVEVQILGDRWGNILTVGERECSVQRRHQKLIEECPCQFLPENVRQNLYHHSLRVAKELQYQSLGTMEWLWDGSDSIYFLEVNTRLQVEHPVTEMVFGLDLVEWQLRVALGQSLDSLHLKPRGHAVEARLCAEDPQNQFFPSGGKIHRLKKDEGVRNDFGYEEGNTVSSDFDSMLGKVISFGETRDQSVDRLIRALEKTCVFGPTTNRAYLIQILSSSLFMKGQLSTQMLETLPYEFDFEAALKLLRSHDDLVTCKSYDEDADLFSPWGAVKRDLSDIDSEDFFGFRYFHTRFSDWKIKIEKQGKEGASSSEGSFDEGEKRIRSPMPGRIVKILKNSSDQIVKGEVILILEAMKMEHKILAPWRGKIKDLKVTEGDQVLPDEVLIELEKL